MVQPAKSQTLANSKRERRFPRYHIAHCASLRAKLLGGGSGSLICIGQGGCGLLRSEEGSEYLVPPSRIAIQIQMDEHGNETIDLVGEVIYVRPYYLGYRAAYYYGVEFLQAHQDQMRSVGSVLEKMAEQGKILRA